MAREEAPPVRKSKATDPPKCKLCGVRHWGICIDHTSMGAIADQSPGAALRLETARDALASIESAQLAKERRAAAKA